MRIALVTEGTYPFAHGGVSVWCHQLVSGMPEHDFHVVALTGTGGEREVWDRPGNLVGVDSIPIWGARRTPVRPRRRGRAALRGSASDPFVQDALVRLGHALLEPEMAVARRGFRRALAAWADLATEQDVEDALVSGRFVELLLDRWGHARPPAAEGFDAPPTVSDAVTVARLVAHALRPLSAEPPRADVVHLVANGLAGLTGLSARRRYGTPYVLSEHGVYLRERYLSYRSSAYSWHVKWLMMRFYRLLTGAVYADATLVAPGNVYNQRWERWDGVPDGQIRTVYNGVDPDLFDLGDDEPDTPAIAWVGRIDPIKDLVTLIRAFGLVHARIPAARLRLFGSAPVGNEAYVSGLHDLITELGLAGLVTFEGRVDEIQDAYAAGQVVALTSISEGFPYTVIEAMSCGRATVSTDVGGVAEAVGDAGVVVPPRDPAAVADALAALLADRPRRVELAARARSRVIELFTLDRSLDAFRTIYRDVARAA